MPSSSSQPARRPHRVSSPADLLDAIPFLLGFHPAESLVLVGLDLRGILVVTARMDLADTGQPDLVEETVAALCRGGARRFVLAVVDDRCAPAGSVLGDLPWAGAVAAVDGLAAGLGAEVTEAVLSSRSRWWSYFCADARCCPAEGRALQPGSSVFAAESAYGGVVALPDRSALADTLAPLPDDARAQLEPLIAAAEHRSVSAVLEDRVEAHERVLVRELLLAARASGLPGWRPPEDAEAARLAVALTSIGIRDEVWRAVDNRRVDGRTLWAELGRRCPSPYDAPPMFLLGWANWRAGNGALAGMAAERALAADPGYSAADLLLAALSQAIDPRTFPGLGRGTDLDRVRERRRRGRPAGAARTRR